MAETNVGRLSAEQDAEVRRASELDPRAARLRAQRAIGGAA